MWLFPSVTGKPMDEAPVRAAFRRCLKAAGIERAVRLHDLRHTYASLARQRGWTSWWSPGSSAMPELQSQPICTPI